MLRLILIRRCTYPRAHAEERQEGVPRELLRSVEVGRLPVDLLHRQHPQQPRPCQQRAAVPGVAREPAPSQPDDQQAAGGDGKERGEDRRAMVGGLQQTRGSKLLRVEGLLPLSWHATACVCVYLGPKHLWQQQQRVDDEYEDAPAQVPLQQLAREGTHSLVAKPLA